VTRLCAVDVGAKELKLLEADGRRLTRHAEVLLPEGAVAVLSDSNKPHGLLNMTGIGGEKFDVGVIPTAFITGEGYRMLFRMQKHGSCSRAGARSRWKPPTCISRGTPPATAPATPSTWWRRGEP